jgi:glycosyltransferase involved in cell wall biosynthesis
MSEIVVESMVEEALERPKTSVVTGVPSDRARGRPIRVAHLVAQLEMGGMEKLLVDFARHADRRHFELRFISLGSRGCLAEEIEACGWPVETVGMPSGLRLSLVLRLARILRRWRADVVHTHNNRPLFHGAPAARLAGVPWVIHTRHGQGYGASRREVRAFRVASVLTSWIACVSEDSARLTVEDGVAPGRVCAIRNGTDLSRFAYTGPQPGGPVVAVARLSPEKDIESLVRAAVIAVREDESFRLEIAGAGSCRTDLERIAAENSLGDHVRFLGEIRDVPALLARASLLVLPSLTEGISLTLLEAMGRGLPVVATRVGGNVEVVVDGETGLLVEPKDPPGLAQAMLRLRRSAEESSRMGRAGRHRAQLEFDVRTMVARYESLYLAGCRLR